MKRYTAFPGVFCVLVGASISRAAHHGSLSSVMESTNTSAHMLKFLELGVHKTSIFLNGNLNVDFFFKQYLLNIFIVSHKHSVLQ